MSNFDKSLKKIVCGIFAFGQKLFFLSFYSFVFKMEARLAEQLLKVAATVEQKIDDELNKLENLGDDDLEEIRRKRMLEMRKAQDKKQVIKLSLILIFNTFF